MIFNHRGDEKESQKQEAISVIELVLTSVAGRVVCIKNLCHLNLRRIHSSQFQEEKTVDIQYKL